MSGGAARLAWRGGPRFSLVALRRRLSPTLPLTAALDEGVRVLLLLRDGFLRSVIHLYDCDVDGVAQ